MGRAIGAENGRPRAAAGRGGAELTRRTQAPQVCFDLLFQLRRRAKLGLGVRAPSSGTTPPGGRPGTTEAMKEVDNRSATASPRGGVESSVVGTRSTAMQVNTIRRRIRTNLRATGEVGLPDCSGSVAHVPGHGGKCAVFRVVGGSRSGRGCAREDGRPAGAGSRKRRPAGVTAAIRAEKRGNARGAKGGRKVERPGP